MYIDPTTPVLIILGLLVFSALFSASETALTAASKARMLTLEQNGNHRAALVNLLWLDKDLLISAILVGNSIANIFSSTIATALFIDIFGENGVVYATTLMSVVIILFVEILPKTIALARPDEAALFLAPFVRALMFVLGPVTRCSRYFIKSLIRPFPLLQRQKNEEEAEEEIRGAIDMHAGLLDDNQQTASMLHAIVDLGDMTVEDVMLHRNNMASVPIGQPTEKLIQSLLDAKHSLVPLWGKSPEDIVGVLDVRKLLAELARQGGAATGLEISNIVTPPWFIPDTTGLLDQLKIFRERHTNLAFVVDEYGVLQGMITLADILEEIVGHYDRGQFNAVNVPKPQADGTIILDGRFPLRELNREMGWNLPDEEASSIAGFVLGLADRIPEPGERFSYKNFIFEVLSRKKNSLSKIRIRLRKA
jgi:Mg2+/Co2+ transporter CorB